MAMIRALCPLLLAAAALAADAPAPTVQDLLARFEAKDWVGAEAACRFFMAKHPDNAEFAYALARALAPQARTDEALAALDHARALGYYDATLAAGDPGLQPLHARPEFEKILAGMAALPIGSGAPYEKSADIPGLRTIENHPEGGLRYRLRLGEHATAASPHRLVLWLHPSGGSMDAQVEPLAPSLAEHGYALAVFPQKHYVGWSDAEGAALAPTIADLGAVPGVDARRPVVMAFSAGGQIAFKLWQARPQMFGALLIDCAYPFVTDPRTNQRSPIDPTDALVAAKTPIFALVGDQDPNYRVWQEALPVYTKAGLPVELHAVAGRGHEFLFAGAEWTAALAWLERLREPEPAATGK